MLKLLNALLAALALSAGVAVQAADCRAVPAEKPARAGDFSRGLLWKIESEGVAPSYLFGTYHTSDPRITRLPCPVEEAFTRSKSYTMEMIFNGAGFTNMAQAMFLSEKDGKTLKQLLGEPLYTDTVRAVSGKNGRTLDGINSMKPWAVMMMLSSPKKKDPGLFLDLKLQARAILDGKENYGLETMDEQIAVFNGMSLEDQVVILRDTMKQLHMAPAALDALTQSYLQRDINGLMRMSEQYKSHNQPAYDELMRRLLTERNHNMAKRMPVRLKEGNAFIAVGALHLPGDDGLLQLLSKAGYRVTRVY